MKPPLATYRLQLQKDFTFSDAASLADYFRALNISHLYLSPIMESVTGSNHGYDVIDFSRISAERSGEPGFRRLTDKLENPLGLILDIVPNHMATDTHNPYWRDILEKGRASPYWCFFDIYDEEKLAAPSQKDHGYRRFFNITSLAGLRVEDETVFDAVHGKTLDLLADHPIIAGLRVDHIDGLADPAAYLERLSARAPLIWVEKITARKEPLPKNWPVAGTTGYEFIDRLNLFMTDAAGFHVIEDYWRKNVDTRWPDFDTCVRLSKEHVMAEYFLPETARLVKMLAAEGVTPQDAENFIRMITAVFSFYRTYGVNDDSTAEKIAAATKLAEKEYGDAFRSIAKKPLALLQRPEILKTWQQFTGPVMAKGLEDRAHYRYTPLAALNEVGCAPVMTADGKESLYAFFKDRLKNFPLSLNATTTHDTKRSEDARARLYALSHAPQEWISFYEKSLAANSGIAKGISPATQYFYYQALIATWPLDDDADEDYRQRLFLYMQKSAREAGMETCWTKPQEDYEQRLESFVRGSFENENFINEARLLAEKVAIAGAVHSLTALTLKILSPGIPDIYQGCESWEFHLVDPDNRRPVDFTARRRLLAEIQAKEKDEGQPSLLRWLVQNWKNGAIKMWLTMKLLGIRKKYLADPEGISEVIPLDSGYILRGGPSSLLVAFQPPGFHQAMTSPAIPPLPAEFMSLKMTDLIGQGSSLPVSIILLD